MPAQAVINLDWISKAETEVLARMKEIPPVFRGVRVPKFTEGLTTWPGRELPRPLWTALGYHVALLNEWMRRNVSSGKREDYLGDFCKMSAPNRNLTWTHTALEITENGAEKYVLEYEQEAVLGQRSGTLPRGYSPIDGFGKKFTSLDLVTLFFRRPHFPEAAEAEKNFAKQVFAEYQKIFGDTRPADKKDFFRPFVEMTGFSPDLPELEGLLNSCGVFFKEEEAKIAKAVTTYIAKCGTKDINWNTIWIDMGSDKIARTPMIFQKWIRDEMFGPYYHYYLSDYRREKDEGKRPNALRADHVPPKEISTRFTSGDIEQARQQDINRGRGRKGATGTPTQIKRVRRPARGRPSDGGSPGSHND